MKSLVKKSLILMPVMLLSLTACGKLSNEQAQERINGYSLANVSEKYASVDIKSECKVNKRTGVFAEDGLMGSVASMIIEALTQDEKAADVSDGFFTADAIDVSGMEDEEGYETKIEYFSYKGNGLKVVSTGSGDVSEEGIKEKVSAKSTVYVFDDGRMEKGDGSMKMSVSGSYLGLTLEGDLDLSFKVSYSWNKK